MNADTLSNRLKKLDLELYFQTGDATLELQKDDTSLDIFNPSFSFRGCLALIDY